MATFDFNLARTVALDVAQDVDEESLSQSFAEICRYLSEFPDSLSWRSKDKPSVVHSEGLQRLAQRYFQGYRRSDFPALPSTVPDPMVSIILREVHGYSDEDCARITLEHQQAMCAENCVGALLERYLDSVLRRKGWHWCVGDFVRAIDFVRVDDNDQWVALQIKNRDNSENSSSSAIRQGTQIQKWFRSFSRDTKRGRHSFTNWDNLPPLMQPYNLNESDFQQFVIHYLQVH